MNSIVITRAFFLNFYVCSHLPLDNLHSLSGLTIAVTSCRKSFCLHPLQLCFSATKCHTQFKLSMHRSKPTTVHQTPLIVLLCSQRTEGSTSLQRLQTETQEPSLVLLFLFQTYLVTKFLGQICPLLTIPTLALLIQVSMSPSFLTCLVTVFYQLSHS